MREDEANRGEEEEGRVEGETRNREERENSDDGGKGERQSLLWEPIFTLVGSP